MINFLEKIISDSNDFDQKQIERISLLEKTVAELIIVVTEQQKIIQELVIAQNNLTTQILSSLSESSLLPEDLN
jgi:hypothetical protein